MPLKIIENQNLKSFNSFGLEEIAQYFCEVNSLDELEQALEFSKSNHLPVLILGGGSNLLLKGPFQGLVIHIVHTGIQVLEENPDRVRLRVSAGENWHAFVLYCLSKGWYRLENLSLIPGSVGAAPMQNIGAYGMEVRELIEAVHFYHRDEKQLKTLSNAECRFGYRESIFKNELKGKVVIWSVDFNLSKIPDVHVEYGDIKAVLASEGIAQPTPRDVSNAVIQIRKSKLPDPAVTGNAGSFFKNPVISEDEFDRLKADHPELPSYPAQTGFVKVPAGWLIEKAGWKGKTRGQAGVHTRQALVLVNYGGAKGEEIYRLSEDIRADVEKKFGIQLETEVNLV